MARHDLDEIKARLRLSDLVGEAVSWDRRKTNAARGDFWACCPFHQERTPSFHVDDRKGRYFCFGCHAKGDHVDFRKAYFGESTRAAIERLAAAAGLGAEMAPSRPVRAPAPPPIEDTETPRRRFEQARKIWQASRCTSPMLMAYLTARGVATEALERAWGGPPPAIRFHPCLSHREQGTGRVVHRGPAMVALMSRPGFIAGVHRTWITAEGRARMSDGQKVPKQWLGWTGRMLGVPVRITAHTRNMVVGEGIETVLAYWSRLQLAWLDGRGEKWSAEAALSLGALTGAQDPRFRGPASPYTGRLLSSAVPDRSKPGWLAPDWVDHLLILGEGSRKDPAEAERRGFCAKRRHGFRTDGRPRRCELILPRGGWGSGKDFADVAAERAA